MSSCHPGPLRVWRVSWQWPLNLLPRNLGAQNADLVAPMYMYSLHRWMSGGAGLKMSDSGQHGGGVSCSLKFPHELGWDEEAEAGAFTNFYRTTVPKLWSKQNLENGWTKG